jgi:isopenicillin N synthase-like dioxygenase
MQGDTGVCLLPLLTAAWLSIHISPHILAPTASDLAKYGQMDTILAGFHSDLNFLTIHGRSRYPGLNIWARNTGKRIPVKIPEGNYLLVQAGKQLEHLTGGLIKAGFHEVVVNERTLTVRIAHHELDRRRA